MLNILYTYRISGQIILNVRSLEDIMPDLYRGRQPFSRGNHVVDTIALRIQCRILRIQLRASRSALRTTQLFSYASTRWS